MRKQAAQKHFRVRNAHCSFIYIFIYVHLFCVILFLMRRLILLLSPSTEDSKQIPIIPGLSSGVGTMIYAGSIGTQIANELIDSYRCLVCIIDIYMYKMVKLIAVFLHYLY